MGSPGSMYRNSLCPEIRAIIRHDDCGLRREYGRAGRGRGSCAVLVVDVHTRTRLFSFTFIHFYPAVFFFFVWKNKCVTAAADRRAVCVGIAPVCTGLAAKSATPAARSTADCHVCVRLARCSEVGGRRDRVWVEWLLFIRNEECFSANETD